MKPLFRILQYDAGQDTGLKQLQCYSSCCCKQRFKKKRTDFPFCPIQQLHFRYSVSFETNGRSQSRCNKITSVFQTNAKKNPIKVCILTLVKHVLSILISMSCQQTNAKSDMDTNASRIQINKNLKNLHSKVFEARSWKRLTDGGKSSQFPPSVTYLLVGSYARAIGCFHLSCTTLLSISNTVVLLYLRIIIAHAKCQYVKCVKTLSLINKC